MAHLGMAKPWLDLLAEGAQDVPDGTFLPVEGVEEGSVVLLAEDRLESALRTMRRRNWKTDGTEKAEILAQVDPRFINHDEHLHKLVHGGVRADGTAFKGGGGIRWGGLVVRGGEAVLRTLGSFEYKDAQQIYQQTLRFSNFGRIARTRLDLSWPDRARLLLRDRMKVHCDCPAFRYYYAYTANQKGFGLYPEIRPAKETNPTNRGGVCKHLHLVLKWLGGQYPKMASELKRYYEVGPE
jgi:hypothetical protein